MSAFQSLAAMNKALKEVQEPANTTSTIALPVTGFSTTVTADEKFAVELGKKPTTFHPFANLPVNLKNKVWEFAMPTEGKIVEVLVLGPGLENKFAEEQTKWLLRSTKDIPDMVLANPLAQHVLEMQHVKVPNAGMEGNAVYVDFRKDIIFFADWNYENGRKSIRAFLDFVGTYGHKVTKLGIDIAAFTDAYSNDRAALGSIPRTDNMDRTMLNMFRPFTALETVYLFSGGRDPKFNTSFIVGFDECQKDPMSQKYLIEEPESVDTLYILIGYHEDLCRVFEADAALAHIDVKAGFLEMEHESGFDDYSYTYDESFGSGSD